MRSLALLPALFLFNCTSRGLDIESSKNAMAEDQSRKCLRNPTFDAFEAGQLDRFGPSQGLSGVSPPLYYFAVLPQASLAHYIVWREDCIA